MGTLKVHSKPAAGDVARTTGSNETQPRWLDLRAALPSIAFLTFLLAFHSACWVYAVREAWVTAEENGGMENVQAAICGVSMVCFAVAAARRMDTVARLFYAGLTLMSLSCMMRELELNTPLVPLFVEWICKPIVRNVWIGALWLGFAAIAIRHRRPLLQHSLAWLRSWGGWLFVGMTVFLVLSCLFDAHVFPLSKMSSRLWEEVLEADGFLLLAICAVRSIRPD